MLNPQASTKQGTINIWSGMILCCGVLSTLQDICQYPLPVPRSQQHPPQLGQPRESPGTAKCPWRGGKGYAKLLLLENPFCEEILSLLCFSRKAYLSQSAFYVSTLDKDKDMKNILCIIYHYSLIGRKQKSLVRVQAQLVGGTRPRGQEYGKKQLGLEQREANMPQLEGAVAVLTWWIAVLSECKADDVSSSSFSQKKPENTIF